MSEFFKDLVEMKRTTAALSGMVGRSPTVLLGVVSDRDDPLNMGRIKCYLSAKGTKTETDWLFRVEPWGRISTPVPDLGTTVTVEYIDGDPHKGIYSGILTNKVTPAWEKDGLRFYIGEDLEVRLFEDTILFRAGRTRLEIKVDGTVAINGAVSVYINDEAKQVATLGAVDDDNESSGADQLISKGWQPRQD